LFPVEQHRLVSLLVEKVVVSPNELELRLRTNGIERVLLELNTQRSEDKVAA
jgi:site-specific DNA recombinase